MLVVRPDAKSHYIWGHDYWGREQLIDMEWAKAISAYILYVNGLSWGYEPRVALGFESWLQVEWDRNQWKDYARKVKK